MMHTEIKHGKTTFTMRSEGDESIVISSDKGEMEVALKDINSFFVDSLRCAMEKYVNENNPSFREREAIVIFFNEVWPKLGD